VSFGVGVPVAPWIVLRTHLPDSVRCSSPFQLPSALAPGSKAEHDSCLSLIAQLADDKTF
jgi:hypothetical protein